MKTIIILSFAFILISCHDEAKHCAQPKESTLIDCRSNNFSPDSATIANQLLGSWKWISLTGCYCAERFYCADKTVIASFDDDQHFEVIENDSLIAQGEYQIVKTAGGIWALDYDISNRYLYDWVWFCNDYVMFEPSFVVDVGYHVFKRVD